MKRIKKIISTGLAALLSFGVMSAQVSAAEKYTSYSYDRWGDSVPSQAGYTAERSITGEILGTTAMLNPSDIFIDNATKLMYIADTGNNRILVTDLNFDKVIKTYTSFDLNGETLSLKGPEGVFVDQYTGDLYVCDTQNSRVIKADTDGNAKLLFEKPASSIYGTDITYNPNKVCVDEMGNVYVVVNSVNKGAVMFDKNAQFLGFFGANTIMATAEVVMNAFWNLISTEEQMLRSVKATPVGFDNFDINGQFIYTVTSTTTTTADQVKKLNPRGDNVLDAIEMAGENFADIDLAFYSADATSEANRSKVKDIDIGDNGEMNVLDTGHGRIHQFDKDGY
jgi:DNA-binding beta-propeller fold protein YncE